MILDWEKYTTWRLFDDKDIFENDIGTIYLFIIKETDKEFAKAKIVGIRETTFNELNDEDWDGHEKFESEKEMYKIYSGYYNQEVDKNSIVKVIKFEIIV